MAAYQPDRGDFVYASFTPHAGHEQAGRRPALILSPLNFNIGTGLAFACPVTNTDRNGPFEVPIPPGAKLTGVILTAHLRSIDWLARDVEFHSRAPNETVLEVLGRVEAILELSLDP